VFTNALGNPVDQTNLRVRSFKALLKRAGLPDIRVHDLRHSAATLLLSMGIHPKAVQELLGHSSIAVTMDVYSHAMPTLQKEAMAGLDRLLEGSLMRFGVSFGVKQQGPGLAPHFIVAAGQGLYVTW